MKKSLLFFVFFICTFVFSQIKVISGKFDFLKDQNEINVVVNYDHVKFQVENYTEQQYIDIRKNVILRSSIKTKADWDKWLLEWNEYKNNGYLDVFIKSINKSKKLKFGRNINTQYTLIVEPVWIYAGWNAGMWSQEAKLSTILKFVETENPQNVLLEYETDKIHGVSERVKDSFMEYGRIASAFDVTGKYFYSHLIRKIKK